MTVKTCYHRKYLSSRLPLYRTYMYRYEKITIEHGLIETRDSHTFFLLQE